MAILSTPIVEKINSFDPLFNTSVSFSYTGNQSVKNRAIVTDNDTGIVVYDRTIATLLLSHTIPAETLIAGKQYLIQIQVFDASNNASNLSEPMLFYCFTTPELLWGEISEPYRSANIELLPVYYQEEGEILKYHQYKLYDGNNNLLSSSDVYYGNRIIAHTFYGLKNNTNYYIQCIGETAHGMSVDTGKKLLTVVYNTIPTNILFQLENHPCSGYISLITNMLIIGTELENDNYTFNPDGSVTLWNNSLTYEDGFSVEGDFALYVEAKEVPVGTFLKTRNNDFTLSIIEVGGLYYCEFKSGEYSLYTALPNAQLITADDSLLVNELGQKIEVINLNYNDDAYVVFELKRNNNIYNLRTYYRIDG